MEHAVGRSIVFKSSILSSVDFSITQKSRTLFFDFHKFIYCLSLFDKLFLILCEFNLILLNYDEIEYNCGVDAKCINYFINLLVNF